MGPGAEAARGARAAPDLVIRDARVLDVFGDAWHRADVAVGGGRILAVAPGLGGGAEEVQAGGRPLVPGFIDGHMHIESTLLTPDRFAAAALPHGTTAVAADPHEIANVLGVPGVRYMLAASADLPFDAFFTASSCVPATALETAGARLDAPEIAQLLADPRVVGLAEVMNYPAVLAGEPGMLAKLAAARDAGKPLDGHAPGLRGQDLQRYVWFGIDSDHEATELAEGQEKLAAGMFLMIREGSAAKNLRALLPAVTAATRHRCLLVTDDLVPTDLVEHGHLNALLAQAVAGGLPPTWALAMVTWNAAHRFRLWDRGAVAPGYRADLVLLEDERTFRPTHVFKDGRLVARDGALSVLIAAHSVAGTTDTVRASPLDAAAIRLPSPAPGRRARAIGLVPDQIVTEALAVEPAVREGQVMADPARDLLKLVVVERHGKRGSVGRGLVRGLGLRAGALASSVAHDSHNIIAAGADDADILAAIGAVIHAGGGLAVAAGGRALAALALPVGGLMSPEPAAAVAEGLAKVTAAARELGAAPRQPFMTLSFLALPVIPALRLSDLGLVDVTCQQLVDLEIT
jgi:adenine deaminase